MIQRFWVGGRTGRRSVTSLVFLAFIVLSLPVLAGAQQTCQPDGDVDQNGSVTAADALLVFQQALNLASLSVCQQTIADVSPQPAMPDGNITAADALCIFQRALSLPSCFDSVPPSNQLPVANAGADRSVDAGTMVILSATASDPDGTIVGYAWEQMSGTTIILAGADTATAIFIAPDVSADETLTFRITVTDDDGATSSDDVKVTVTAGFAPADEDTFDDLVVGKRLLAEDDPSGLDFVSAGQFIVIDVGESDTYRGTYSYENTGPNSGRVEFVYDDGDRCTGNLTFDSISSGTGTGSCDSGDGESETSSWQLVDIPDIPDLMVQSPSVSDSSPNAGAPFTLSVTVHNQGAGSSGTTILRYYRSSDAAISTSDTEVGTDAVGGLSASGTSDESISLAALSSTGTYYYGACVDTVSGESNTGNNCSSGVRLTVAAASPPDTYEHLGSLVVAPGRVRFLFFSAGRCIVISNTTLNGVTYTIENSKWQTRSDSGSAWRDISGTAESGKICSYNPSISGEYRLVAEINIGGVTGMYASNTLTVP